MREHMQSCCYRRTGMDRFVAKADTHRVTGSTAYAYSLRSMREKPGARPRVRSDSCSRMIRFCREQQTRQRGGGGAPNVSAELGEQHARCTRRLRCA